MGIPQFKPISSLPVTASAQQQQQQPNPSLVGGVGDFTQNAPKKRVEKEAGRSFSIMDQLMSALGAFDAMSGRLAAQRDPTIPALLNSGLGTYANFQNAGGVNANQVLGGNFGGTNFMQPVNFGSDAGGPFDIPYQKPGGDPMVQALWEQFVRPAAGGQISHIGQTLAGFGSPSSNKARDYTQADMAAFLQSLGITPPSTQAFMPAPAAAPVLDSFATGTPFVPQTGNYQLHRGEAVIPAQQNPLQQIQPPAGPMPGPMPMGAAVPGQSYDKRQHGMLGYQGGGGPAPGVNVAQPMPQPPVAPPPTTGGPIPIQPPQPPGTTFTGPIAPVVDTYTPPAAQTTQPPAPATGQWGGADNPLQQALQQLSQMLAGGGPITQGVQNTLNQQTADTVSTGQQQALMDLRARMGGRGLGGSGLQMGMERDIGNAGQMALTQAQNQIGLNAANTNYGAMQNTANSLLAGGLGAGQFGLQQAQFNLGQSQSMLDQLLAAIRNSYTPASAA